MRPSTKGQAGVSRRTVLKGAAAAIAGFPAIVSAQPVTLRYLADLSHGEIAEVMQTSEDAARRNVFEGLRRLREHVEFH